jgi:hypothetical protein
VSPQVLQGKDHDGAYLRIRSGGTEIAVKAVTAEIITPVLSERDIPDLIEGLELARNLLEGARP